MKGRKIMKKSGFTLAEVLIVLGIIGVVAAMTIPTLMNQTSQAEFRTGFKKMLSTLNQVVNMNVALDSSDFSVLNSGTDEGSIYYMFNQRMNVLQTTTGNSDINAESGNYTLFFNDGMALSFNPSSMGNGKQSCTGSDTANHYCMALIDVNGKRKPNSLTTESTALKDQYLVIFENQQVVPARDVDRSVMYSTAQ